MGGAGLDHVADVADAQGGNAVVTGYFSAVLIHNGQALVSAGSTDILVAKFDAAGSVLWWRRAGGSSTDRGSRIIVDASGDVFVVGQYMGAADIFGDPYTSGGGTLDLFIAKLDGSNGQTIWTRTAGSADGVDVVNGIAVGASGALVITGEFRGTAVFGPQQITSLIDPLTLQFRSDVYVARYSSGGTLNWLKHGAAPHADKGVSVAIDALDRVHVAGQYSDTIQFDLVHNTTATNGIFLVTFNASGQEVGFTRASGAGITEVREIAIGAGNELYMLGDQQGQLTYFDNQPDQLPSASTYAYFLLRIDANGQYLGGSNVGSDSPVQAHSLSVQGDTLVAFGEFTCQFTGFSDHHGGDGLFMATGPEDLFISAHHRSSLSLIQAQQLGGHGGKRAGRLRHVAGAGTYLCGSHEEWLILPSDGGNWSDLPGSGCLLFSANSGTYCGDAHYGSFAADTVLGLYDGFVSRYRWKDRQPYDFWRRSGAGCDRDALEPCIYLRGDTLGQCRDTVVACGVVELIAMDQYKGIMSWRELHPDICRYPNWVAPDLQFLWSDGSSECNRVVSTPGWAWCTISTENGCFSWTDSVYVAVSTVPPAPQVSDGLGVNIANFYPDDIIVCGPSVWLWCPNVPPGYQVTWESDGGIVVPNDSILVTSTDLYTVTITSPEGCSLQNDLNVTIGAGPPVPLPNITGVDVTYYFGGIGGGVVLGDTLHTCEANCIIGYAEFEYYVNGVPAVIDNTLQLESTSDCGPYYNSVVYGAGIWSLGPINGSGWYSFSLILRISNGPCGTDDLYLFPTRQIYVNEIPPPQATVLGPLSLCPADTATLALICFDCDNAVWSGPGLIYVSPDADTALAVITGTYEVVVSATAYGQTCSAVLLYSISQPQAPELLTDPPDGYFCPGDSIAIYTPETGLDYQWSGPSGSLPSNSGAVWVTEPGDYDLVMTNVDGCVVANGPISVSYFGAPFLSAWPVNAICDGDPVLLEVFATDQAIIQWLPPLSGNSTTQVITTAGTYSCTVTHCGAIVDLSIEIFTGGADAIVSDPGPFSICAGSEVLLEAVPGQYQYLWLPSGTAGPDLLVDQAGQYNLVALDTLGCADTSAAVLVSLIPFTVPATVTADSVCLGEQVTLSATASGAVTWYGDAAATQVLGTDTFLVVNAMLGDTVYLVQQENTCTGAVLAVPLPIIIPPAMVVQGDTIVCSGETVLLFVQTDADSVLWSTPAGVVDGATVLVVNAGATDSGVYSVSGMWQGCPTDTGQVQVSISDTPPIGLPDELDLCTGTTALLAAPNGYDTYLWSTGDSTEAISISEHIVSLIPRTRQSVTSSVYLSFEGG